MLEDAVRKAFEKKHDGEILLPVCASHETQEWMRCSLDGLTEAGEPVEMKCPTTKRFLEVKEMGEEAPVFKLYWAQVQHQIYVTKATRAFICFYTEELPEGEEGYIEMVIERDDNFINDDLLPACQDFWARIEQDKEPPKDPDRDIYVPSAEDYSQWDGLAEARKRQDGQKKILETQLKVVKSESGKTTKEMVGMMGDFIRADASDVKITRSNVQGSIDYRKAVEELMLEIDESLFEPFRRKGRSQVRVTVSRTSEEVAERNIESLREAAMIKAVGSLAEIEMIYDW